MAVEHTSLPVAAVQFHPESILTNPRHGLRILENCLRHLRFADAPGAAAVAPAPAAAAARAATTLSAAARPPPRPPVAAPQKPTVTAEEFLKQAEGPKAETQAQPDEAAPAGAAPPPAKPVKKPEAVTFWGVDSASVRQEAPEGLVTESVRSRIPELE